MIEGGDMMQHKILTDFLFFSIVAVMIGFLVNGCNGVPPEMVEEAIAEVKKYGITGY